MRVIILLCIMLMIVALSKAFVCPKNYCNKVKCQTTKENCQGELVPRSSTCGCCPTCVKYIKPGGFCSELLNHVMGPVNRFLAYKCSPGFICARNRCSPLL